MILEAYLRFEVPSCHYSVAMRLRRCNGITAFRHDHYYELTIMPYYELRRRYRITVELLGRNLFTARRNDITAP